MKVAGSIGSEKVTVTWETAAPTGSVGTPSQPVNGQIGAVDEDGEEGVGRVAGAVRRPDAEAVRTGS